MRSSLHLSTRLGISHGVLVVLLVVLFGVMLQGLVRMLNLMGEIRDNGRTSVDEEEDLHHAAWNIDVAMRHGRAACLVDPRDPSARTRMEKTRADLVSVLGKLKTNAAGPLRSSAERYLVLADASLAGDTCAFLVDGASDARRTKLDEEITDAWIARLHELHEQIREKEDAARRVGYVTTFCGVAVALFAALAAIAVARGTGRSVTDPIRRLANAATRLGEGNFETIPAVSGPREVEDLWRDLERARSRLLEIDQLKQGFLASVSHEMRSPLTSVREALALLADDTSGELTPKQRRIVFLATRACEREVRIVEALLDLSRFRSGMPLKREAACDLDHVLQAAVNDERDDADRRGVQIAVADGQRVPILQIDSALVERAVANLVRNAVSVSNEGQCVRIVRGVADAEGRTVSVDVIDEGPGLAAEIRGVLFRPFTAASVPRAGRPAGLGLGLAFAREVARAHGGDITVPRSDPRGTVFRLELPVAVSA